MRLQTILHLNGFEETPVGRVIVCRFHLGPTRFAGGGLTTETPEPAASLMVVGGLAMIGLGRVRRRRS